MKRCREPHRPEEETRVERIVVDVSDRLEAFREDRDDLREAEETLGLPLSMTEDDVIEYRSEDAINDLMEERHNGNREEFNYKAWGVDEYDYDPDDEVIEVALKFVVPNSERSSNGS